MQTETFIKFLEKRNMGFIDQISSESALGLISCLKQEKSGRKKCIIVSFDPPLTDPPFAFEWSQSDVFYYKDLNLTDETYKEIESKLLKVELPFIIFVEKKNPPHRRKIVRWIKGFKEASFLNNNHPSQPKFILAEYSRPLFLMHFSEFKTEE